MSTPALPLTTVTVDSLKQELIDRISASFTDWSDQRDSNNMIMLLEAMAGLAEMNYAYINRMGREAFLLFALDPRNVIAHAKGLGYTPRFQSPSSVSAIIVSATPLADTTVIPVGTKFGATIPGVTYETADNVSIQIGQLASPPVILKQRESWADDFLGTGLASQQVQLNNTPVMPTTIQVFIDGVEWLYVDTFVDSDPTSLVFTWLMTTSGNATLVFGNGISGKKPPSNAAGRAFYKTGGGKAGAIGPNQLGTTLSVITDLGNGAILSLTAVNASGSIPGSDPETIDQIRTHAIASLRAPRVLMTLTDIEDAVSAVPGVLVTKAVNWELIPALPHYIVQVYVVPNGFGQPNDQLIADVTTLLTVTKPLVMGHQLSIFGPTYRNLDFQLSVAVERGSVLAVVQNAVRQQLIDLFDPTISNVWGFSPQFGMGVFTSQIIAVLQQVDGVRNLSILAPGDTQLAVNEYPVLGNINFV